MSWEYDYREEKNPRRRDSEIFRGYIFLILFIVVGIMKIKNTDFKEKAVIDELNHSLEKKEISQLYMYDEVGLIISLQPRENSDLKLRNETSFLSIGDVKPYLHIMIDYEKFSYIEVFY